MSSFKEKLDAFYDANTGPGFANEGQMSDPDGPATEEDLLASVDYIRRHVENGMVTGIAFATIGPKDVATPTAWLIPDGSKGRMHSAIHYLLDMFHEKNGYRKAPSTGAGVIVASLDDLLAALAADGQGGDGNADGVDPEGGQGAGRDNTGGALDV